jgi:hypothetical protein
MRHLQWSRHALQPIEGASVYSHPTSAKHLVMWRAEGCTAEMDMATPLHEEIAQLSHRSCGWICRKQQHTGTARKIFAVRSNEARERHDHV